jgi:hypothetical protein
VSAPTALVVWAIEHSSRQMWLGPGCNGKGLQFWGWGPSIFRHDTREAAQARLDVLRAQGSPSKGTRWPSTWRCPSLGTWTRRLPLLHPPSACPR